MTNQNTAVLLGEDGDIEKLRALSDAAPAGPWDALTPEIVGCPSGERTNIAYAPGIAPFLAGAVNYVRAALARANNTDPVRALIADWREGANDENVPFRVRAGLRLRANELEDAYNALASAPPSAPVGVEGLRQGNWSHPDGGRIVGWVIEPEDADRMGADAMCLPREAAEALAKLRDGYRSDVDDATMLRAASAYARSGGPHNDALRAAVAAALAQQPAAPSGADCDVCGGTGEGGSPDGDCAACRGIGRLAAPQQPAGVDDVVGVLLEKSAALEKVLPVSRDYAHAYEVQQFRAALTAAQQQGGAK